MKKFVFASYRSYGNGFSKQRICIRQNDDR